MFGKVAKASLLPFVPLSLIALGLAQPGMDGPGPARARKRPPGPPEPEPEPEADFGWVERVRLSTILTLAHPRRARSIPVLGRPNFSLVFNKSRVRLNLIL